MIRRKRLYTDKEAALYGARLICAREGHDIRDGMDGYSSGGVQMQYDREPGQAKIPADRISCARCDANFEVTYPEIGKVLPPGLDNIDWATARIQYNDPH